MKPVESQAQRANEVTKMAKQLGGKKRVFRGQGDRRQVNCTSQQLSHHSTQPPMNTLTTSLDAFVIDFWLRISRHDLRTFNFSHSNPGAPYPSLPDMVRHIGGRQFHPEAVPDFHNNDALFLFAVRAHFDEVNNVLPKDQ